MSEIILTPEQYDQALRVAAEVGASTALRHYEDRQAEATKELWDKRLRNTKLLLKNYRLFKDHVANAVFSEEQADEINPLQVLRELMLPGKSGTMFVEAIKRSAARTRITVAHIDNILRCYQAYCLASNSVEDKRLEWRVCISLRRKRPQLSLQRLMWSLSARSTRMSMLPARSSLR